MHACLRPSSTLDPKKTDPFSCAFFQPGRAALAIAPVPWHSSVTHIGRIPKFGHRAMPAARATMLTVHVVSAHGLQRTGPDRLADSYLCIAVGKHSRKSSVVQNTLDPRFEQSFDFYPDDTNSASLHVQVLDKAHGKDSGVLGECTVHLATALANQSEGQPWEQPLHPQGTLLLRLTELDVPAHLIASGRLVVHVIDADGLPPCDPPSGLADPYVKLSCGGFMRRSRVLEQTLQPRWDEPLSFVGRLRELQATALLVRVYDQDQGEPPPGALCTSVQLYHTSLMSADTEDDFLGEVRIVLTDELLATGRRELEVVLTGSAAREDSVQVARTHAYTRACTQRAPRMHHIMNIVHVHVHAPVPSWRVIYAGTSPPCTGVDPRGHQGRSHNQ